ncbi:PREDICTED: uncharacterized protein LOC105131087 [Populus euphratica]|uniref:Uncharacterized protein LOC105117888 n=1 Tax=Populus euphratica TaxID=75702 RepID=A0AAJ6TNI8_POPEU|nr:PREDICTED: uncharacterized protein LOC105117888 [Populus euphratica]XP_011032180.1 PREDICTED: uncharacterized protein LOC105131087 [Populus euphratica]
MEFYKRPNRSDVHVSVEEEAKQEEETRGYFEGIAPKRHSKPQRSEYSIQYVDALTTNGDQSFNPEYVEFQRLETDPQKIISNESSKVTEEFVETEYYQDLNCVDKQHHTTGTGFIKTENEYGKRFSLAPDSTTSCHASCKGNPATNDWVPADADMVISASDKPKRSESSDN